MEQFFEIEVNGRTNNMALRIGEIREDLRHDNTLRAENRGFRRECRKDRVDMIESWTGSRLACWKATHRLANMGVLLLGVDPRGNGVSPERLLMNRRKDRNTKGKADRPFDRPRCQSDAADRVPPAQVSGPRVQRLCGGGRMRPFLLAVIAVFGQTVQHAFIHQYDDEDYVSQ